MADEDEGFRSAWAQSLQWAQSPLPGHRYRCQSQFFSHGVRNRCTCEPDMRGALAPTTTEADNEHS